MGVWVCGCISYSVLNSSVCVLGGWIVVAVCFIMYTIEIHTLHLQRSKSNGFLANPKDYIATVGNSPVLILR